MWLRRRSSPEDVGTDMPVQYALATDPILNAANIPVRLTMTERKTQRLMRGIMLASSYTNLVDVANLPPSKRAAIIHKEVYNSLLGFLSALDIRAGCKLMSERDFEPHMEHIISAIDACRRFKIMNPDLLRTDYVKFLYLLQDAMKSDVVEMLGCQIAAPVLTVGDYCKKLNMADLLKDERLGVCITPVPKISDRGKLNKALRFKDVAVDRLASEFARKKGITADEVCVAIRSLNDANCFANDNADSASSLIELLKKYFNPTRGTTAGNLSIAEGLHGSRLTHEHAMQYMYVLQSLSLWKNISRHMYSLWIIAEGDFLDGKNAYELKQTGQGIQRVQKAPNLYRAISDILDATKSELGQWVGRDKIHLGDSQVPNAFHFIDKYGQISRIIVPLLRTIATVDDLEKDAEKKAYVEEVWGGCENAKVAVLCDFFRHGFDGSGGDNMEDAGSCIDGRLTSAWNWCSSIRSKPFYPLFLMAGFTSFDGDLSL